MGEFRILKTVLFRGTQEKVYIILTMARPLL